jgi:hypothetical protein
MWILSVCIGVLWGGMCERNAQFIYPTEQACIHEMNRVNARVINGFARCNPKEVPKALS